MIDKTMLEQLAGDVCTTMLGLELTPAGGAFQATDVGLYCGHIGIDGDWQSQIFVFCANGLSQRIASSMFMTEPDDLTDGEIGDAIGELVNILGGNVKGVLPGENSLSLPSVDQLDGDQIPAVECNDTDAYFQCDGHALTIRVSKPVECQSTTG